MFEKPMKTVENIKLNIENFIFYFTIFWQKYLQQFTFLIKIG